MKLKTALVAIGILSAAGIVWTVRQLRNPETQAGTSRVIAVTDEQPANTLPANTADQPAQAGANSSQTLAAPTARTIVTRSRRVVESI